MKKLIFALLLFSFVSFLIGCGDSGTKSIVTPPAATVTSQFVFVREAPPGNVTSTSAHLSQWSLRGQRLHKLHRGLGIAPWDTVINPGTESVVLMQNDGTGENVLANQAGWFDSVQLSIDGKKGIFSAETGTDYNAQIFVVDMTKLPTVSMIQLTSDAEDHGWPQLSANGSQVVAMKWVNNQVQAMTMSSSGGAESVISSPSVWVLAPSFTPDGKIVFGDDYTGQVTMMNADGSAMTVLTTPPVDSWDSFPTISADGKTVFFNRNGDIFSQSIDGTNLKQLTTDGMNWDPLVVKDKIVFVSYRDQANGGEIYSMSPDGSNQKRLTNNNQDEYFIWD